MSEGIVYYREVTKVETTDIPKTLWVVADECVESESSEFGNRMLCIGAPWACEDFFKRFANKQEQVMKYTDVTDPTKNDGKVAFGELEIGDTFLSHHNNTPRIKSATDLAREIAFAVPYAHNPNTRVRRIRIVNMDYEII